MNKKINNEICDYCGHFWSCTKSAPNSCSICGLGSRVKIGSEMDFRRIERSNKRGQNANFKRRMVSGGFNTH